MKDCFNKTTVQTMLWEKTTFTKVDLQFFGKLE